MSAEKYPIPEGRRPFKKIMLGLDLSDQNAAVAAMASYLADKMSSSVIVVTVINVPTNFAANEMDGMPANDEEIRLQESLRESLLGSFGNKLDQIEIRVLHGDPAERISEYAEYVDCDLIIVGSRTHGALRKTIFGSVSDSVAARSKRSVLIVK